MKGFVDVERARSEEQKKVLEHIARQGICPFCPENFRKNHKKDIFKRGEYWLVTENMWPYMHTKRHLLFLHLKHIEHVSEISPEAFAELLDLVKEFAVKFRMDYGVFAIRFGDGPNGGSVKHLHAHVIVADPDVENYKAPRIKAG